MAQIKFQIERGGGAIGAYADWDFVCTEKIGLERVPSKPSVGRRAVDYGGMGFAKVREIGFGQFIEMSENGLRGEGLMTATPVEGRAVARKIISFEVGW